MADLRHDSPAERLGTARKGGAVLVIACCAFLAAPAAASAAKSQSEGAVSSRYHVVSCDTAANLERAGSRAAAAGAMGATLEQHARIPAFYLGLPPRERHSTVFRYQSRDAISNTQWIVSLPFFAEQMTYTSGTCAETVNWTSNGVAGRISSAEARFLLQLAVALAAAYVLFLAAWFWGTRDRRSRVESAVRS
jgi:hypothetical protein